MGWLDGLCALLESVTFPRLRSATATGNHYEVPPCADCVLFLFAVSRRAAPITIRGDAVDAPAHLAHAHLSISCDGGPDGGALSE